MDIYFEKTKRKKLCAPNRIQNEIDTKIGYEIENKMRERQIASKQQALSVNESKNVNQINKSFA